VQMGACPHSGEIYTSGVYFFMVALWNRETIYIFMLWFVMAALCN